MQELKILPGNTLRGLQVEKVDRPKTRKKAMENQKVCIKSQKSKKPGLY
jgi:hypothetical protein